MKISATFDTFDEAENCARALKQRCEGINAIRIRKRGPLQDGQAGEPIGDPPAQIIPFAFYNGVTASETMQDQVTGGPYAGAFAMDFGFGDDGDEAGQGMDGPHGRQECRMDVLAQPYAAHQIEQTIFNEHGRKVRRVQL